VVDTFYVTDSKTGGLVTREARERVESVLLKALTDGPVDFRALITRQKSARSPYQPHAEERIETRVVFDNDTSGHRTVIDIETEDKLGLLYEVSRVLTGLGLDISLARISTEKGAAIDSFYVAERDGQKVSKPERQRLIAERLLVALRGLAQHG